MPLTEAPDLKFTTPHCAKCGNLATGTCEQVAAVQHLTWGENGYACWGHIETFDESGNTETGPNGGFMLHCSDCCFDWESEVEDF